MAANTLGRYQIIREIARSNDVVYEAVDTSINRRLAVKELLLPPNLAGVERQERVDRFYREARAAGSLSHPNIVTIFEAGEDHGRHFIAMEFLEGQTLRDLLQIEGKLSVERAVEITVQACDALAYAHSRRVVHRDIKPDNIQILPSGQIKITDFGIARLMEEPSLTANGQVFGTPSYMSPEQIAGKPLDQRSDIFSLGVVLYEMLVGRKPFTGDTVVTITYNIMNQDATIPSTVPAYLSRVISRSLAKDPDLRYSSAAEMAADLDPHNFTNAGVLSQSDPFGATTNIPSPSYGPPSGGHPQSPAPPDPLAGLPPLSAPRPRKPSRPLLSPETVYFFKVMLTVIIISAVVVGFIWIMSVAYQHSQRQAADAGLESYINEGNDYYNNQSYVAAVEQYNEALRRTADPQVQSTIKQNLVNCYLELAYRAVQSGDATPPEQYYRTALYYDPNDARAHNGLGNEMNRLGRQDDALAEWQKAFEMQPGTPAANEARKSAATVYYNRGIEASNAGKSDEAKTWWRKAVDIAPGTNIGIMAQQKIEGGA